MRVFKPRYTQVEGAEIISGNPLTPGNKTHKTPQTEVLSVLLPPLRGCSEIFKGASTPQAEGGPSHHTSPDSHPSTGSGQAPVDSEEDPTSRERKVAELIARYQAGEFTPKVRDRLTEIFQQNPPDAEARLLKACEYLGITGEGLEEADRLAQQAYEAAGWPWVGRTVKE